MGETQTAAQKAEAVKLATEKRDKYVEIANLRTNKVINNLKALAKVRGGRYVYTDADVEKIGETILAQLNKTVADMKAKGTVKTEDSFSLT